MIALLVAFILPGATPASVNFPFHLSGFVGIESDVQSTPNPWIEIDAQAEFGTIAFLRGAYAQPGGGAADLTQEMHTVCLGTEWRRDWWWFAAGAGWTWLRQDTTAIYRDPRDILVEDQNGLHSTVQRSLFFASSRNIEWRWPQRVEDNGPYLMGEIGVGWEHASVCLRAEYRVGPALGTFWRFRIP
jgi:hypothetical protein